MEVIKCRHLFTKTGQFCSTKLLSKSENTEKYVIKIASEMPVPHSLGKYFQHHEIQKYCISTNFRILSEHCQLYKGPNNV